MARWIVKASRFRDQVRITIPKALAVEYGFMEAELVEIKAIEDKKLEVRIFEQAESKSAS